MNTRTFLRRLLPALVLAAGFGLLPSSASADQGRVHLNDGSVIRGEIVTYEPGSALTLRMSNGSMIELTGDQIARVEIGLEEAPAATDAIGSTAVTPAPATAPASVAPSLSVLPNRPRLAGPIVLGSVGVLLVAIGAPMYTNSFTYYDTYEFTPQGIAGATLMGVGGALMISGFGVWLALRVKARRAWDAENGERALRVTPSVGRRHAGLQLAGTF